MGSVRNPVGPLPSSIYWRRRAVVLCLLALAAVLILWAVTSGGEDGGNSANGSVGKRPATSITPGPTTSSSGAISGRPGGRDPSDGGGTATGGTSGPDGGGTGGQDNGQDGDGANGTGDAGTGSGGASPGAQVPAGSSLPECTSSGTELTLRSVKNAYEPGEKPRFELTAANSSDTACKMDFGPTAAVLTVTNMADDHVWSTEDCPADRSAYFLRVPAGGSATHTVEWNRRTSLPQCATPAGASAPHGTYWVGAKVADFGSEQPRSFALTSV